MSQNTPSTAPATQESTPEKVRASLTREILSGGAMVSVLAVVVALVVGALLIVATDPKVLATMGYFFSRPADFFMVAGSRILESYSALFRGAVFDWQAPNAVRAIRPLTESMTFATPLILTGLGIAIGFRAGLFNIGGQGQVVVGAMTAAYIGYAWDLPVGLHLVLAVIGGAVGGAVWAGIAGLLKARFGANEVIVTIMLNNIAVYLLAYLLKVTWFKQSDSTLPQSPVISESAQLFGLLGPSFRLHAGFLLAILMTGVVWWLMERSTWGFEFRAVGENPQAARTAGISVGRVTVLVMLAAGVLAGMGGAAHVLGTEEKLTVGIAGSLGFDAITVALLGRSRPIGTFVAGLLFGAFKAGGFAMQAQTGTPIDIVLVIQSIIVLLIAAPPLVRAIFRLPAPVARRKESVA